MATSLCSWAQQPTRSAADNFNHDIEGLKDYFHIPGIAVLVTRNGQVVSESYLGYADIENKRLADETTLFPIASMTKTYVTVLLIQWVESGDLNLNESINKYLDHSNLPDSVKIKHVLSHTSEGVPGSFFNYSNRFSLLTQVAEKIGGKPLGELVQDNILKPRGLDDTFPMSSQA